jgi:site-specific DNA-methyltransferase (adenine-specific)
MAVRIEDAGFEIRDMIAWVYGSGFPKSLNIGKAVDKIHVNEREELGKSPFEGWGTALKPALEPITVARKPISEKNIAQNVLKYGTGGLNIDGSRVEYQNEADKASSVPGGKITTKGYSAGTGKVNDQELDKDEWVSKMSGRFPANLIHDGSDEVVGLFPNSNSTGGTGSISTKTSVNTGGGNSYFNFGDSGSAARFFYCAKASKSERNAGLDGFEPKRESDRIKDDGVGGDNPRNRSNNARANHHPTVKPVALMRYLVRMVTPKDGIVLDPFNGSGTTGIAAKLENVEYVGIELDPEYCKISEARIAGWESEPETKQLKLT